MGPLLVATSPTIRFVIQTFNNFCRQRHAGTLRSDSLGCRLRAPIIRDGTGPRAGLDGKGSLDLGKISGEKFRNFWLVGGEAFSDPTSIIIGDST